MPENAAMAVSAANFRRACSRYATGVAITTTNGPEGEPHGLTVNSFTSVSLDPPMVLVCVDYRCNILQHFRAHPYFGVNVLSEHQQDLSVRFAERIGDRFDGIGWRRGAASRIPLLDGVLATFECRVENVTEAGDHAIFIGTVVAAGASEGNPLMYFGGRYARL